MHYNIFVPTRTTQAAYGQILGLTRPMGAGDVPILIKAYLPLPYFLSSIDEAITLYKEYSKANKRSYRLDDQYCKVFIEEWGNKTKLKDITPQKIERFKVKKMSKNTNATVNRYLEALSKLFNVAIANNLTKDNPLKQVKKLKQKNYKIRFLSKDEEKTTVYRVGQK